VLLAEVARLELQHSSTMDVPRNKIELLRARVATTVSFLVFVSCGGVGIECFTSDILTIQQDGTILYHRDMKGQRGVAIEYRVSD
jgi:hypothetical protein